MLTKIDKTLLHIPNKTINWLTFGTKGSSICARIYLENLCVSPPKPWLIRLMRFIDVFEAQHCRRAARLWRINYLKTQCEYPLKYYGFIRKVAYLKYKEQRYVING